MPVTRIALYLLLFTLLTMSIPATEGGLHPCHNACDENHGAYDMASSRIVISHAESRRQDEWDGYYGAYHGQVVLKRLQFQFHTE
jgi:hypothetical protein